MGCRTWGCRVLGVVCVSVGMVTGVSAEPDEDVIPTEEVVVSATKTAIPLNQVTSAVEVISGRELQDKKVKTLFDGLRLAQGITAFQSGGPGNLATVQMRGTKSNHTMVLIDGVIANSPTSGLFDFGGLSADNIDRIEILRGAQSMLYGSDAMGGVINIITKRGEGTPTASAFAEFGSFATLREGVSAAGAKGPFDFSVAMSRWDTSGFSTVNYQRGATERDGFHNWQASAKLGVALPKDGRLEFALRWWNSDTSFDGFDGNVRPADVFGSRLSQQNLVVSGSYAQPLTDWWSSRITVAQGRERIRSRSGLGGRNLATGQTLTPDPFCGFPADPDGCFFPFTSEIASVNRRLEWQHDFRVAKPLLVSAGYQFREEQGENLRNFGDPATRILSSHAGFVQAQLNLGERFFATAGGRHDRYNIFGDATTYRTTAGYLIHETGTKLRGSYATGFKAPTMNDLYFISDGFPVNNPNLKPERSQSLDAGLDQSFWDGRLTVSGNYFWNRFRDLIQFPLLGAPTLCPAATFGFCPLNIAQARSQGWELSFKARLTHRLELRGQYTKTHTRDLTTGKRLARWPVDQASVGVGYQPLEGARVYVDYRFVGTRNNDIANSPGQRLGSFGVVNLAASYDVTRQWQVYARIENLLGQDYEEILGFGTPIRSVFGGVKFTY